MTNFSFRNFSLQSDNARSCVFSALCDRLRDEYSRASRTKSLDTNTKPATANQLLLGLALVLSFTLITPVYADLETARDLMDAGDYQAAYRELWPAARSGNAEAEELIGVMYAMGLGVERDDRRAFEWYLRSAMKGHPGAQSGVGWYFEVGRGLPSIDLVRAYLWYTLSAIGGDPDAAISLEEVVKKMSRQQIDAAHDLIEDYKSWMYPFR